MTVVFVGGSRHLWRLNDQVRARLDKIVESGFPILVGDANGIDKAVQQYLSDKRYGNVEVFCSGGPPRNNVGGWRLRSVPAKARIGTAEFYSAKDEVMADEATIGLMVWDGKSVGTLLNVLRLLNRKKIAVVYSAPEKKFIEFKTSEKWRDFIDHCETNLRRKVAQRAALEAPAGAKPDAQMSLLN